MRRRIYFAAEQDIVDLIKQTAYDDEPPTYEAKRLRSILRAAMRKADPQYAILSTQIYELKKQLTAANHELELLRGGKSDGAT